VTKNTQHSRKKSKLPLIKTTKEVGGEKGKEAWGYGKTGSSHQKKKKKNQTKKQLWEGNSGEELRVRKGGGEGVRRGDSMCLG